MKTVKKLPRWSAALLAGLACTADLLLAVDPVTGFVKAGPLWPHYLLFLAAAAVVAALARRVPGGLPAGVPRRPLGVWMELTGAALAAAGGCSLFEALQWGSGWLPFVRGALLALAAFWFFVRGAAAYAGGEAGTPPTAWELLAVLPGFFVLLLERFVLDPPPVARVGLMLRVLDAVLALTFLPLLGRLFYLPDTLFGRLLFAAGGLCCLFGTFAELPRTLAAALAGGADPLQVLLALVYGLLGCCGAAAAYCAWNGAPAAAKKTSQ